MSAPLGPDNINTTGWPFLISAGGHGDTTFTDLPSHDEDFVKQQFKERFLGSPGSGVSVWTRNGGWFQQLATLLGPGVGPFVSLLSGISGAGAGVANALTGLANTWNHFWDGIFGTSGSTGKTATDVQTAAATVTSAANTANTKADTALAKIGTLSAGAGAPSASGTTNAFYIDTATGDVYRWT